MLIDPWIGLVFDKYGVKPLVIVSSIGYLLSILLLSFCKGKIVDHRSESPKGLMLTRHER